MKQNSSAQTIKFRPVMDWWIASGVVVVLLMIAASIPIVIWHVAGIPSIIAVIILIIAFLLIIDRAFFLTYILDSEGLRIQGQVWHYLFPYRSMRTITNGGFISLITTSKRKRFALSTNCVVITLQDQPWNIISVSPSQKQQFLSALLNKIDQERSGRATYTRSKRKRGE